jgi:hypothetical protein
MLNIIFYIIDELYLFNLRVLPMTRVVQTLKLEVLWLVCIEINVVQLLLLDSLK